MEQEKLDIKLLNKFIKDLYKSTEIKRIELDIALKLFYEDISIKDRKDTLNYYKSTLKDIIEFLKDNNVQYIDQVNKSIIEKYIKIKQCFIKNITINKRINALKYLIRFLYENDMIDKIKLNIEKLKVDPKEIQIYTTEEIKKIEQYIDTETPNGKLAILLLLTTGIRRTEPVFIKNKNINFEEKTIYLDVTKTNQPRYIFLLDKTLEEIKKIYNKNNEYLFTNKNTKERLTAYAITSLCRRMKERLKIQINPHKFRHTYATILLEKGANIETVRLLLGHSTYEMTKKYLHVKNKKLSEENKAFNPINI